jgi:hypothetical protein
LDRRADRVLPSLHDASAQTGDAATLASVTIRNDTGEAPIFLDIDI